MGQARRQATQIPGLVRRGPFITALRAPAARSPPGPGTALRPCAEVPARSLICLLFVHGLIATPSSRGRRPDTLAGMSGPAPIQTAGDRKPRRALRRRVAELLGAGRLVALPTETVYGIAARADHPAALAALRQLKAGTAGAGQAAARAERPFTWHVASATALESFEHQLPLARRLAERFWPGPLTMVLEGVPPGLEAVAQAGWTGLRQVAQATTLGLLADLDFPVVATSANLAGEEPLTDAGAVAEAFGSGLDLVVDGGPCRLAQASTVLALGPGRFEVLRQGILEGASLRSAAGLSLTFVCTGNTCRSPMAESLARLRLAERLGLRVAGKTGAELDTELANFGFSLSSAGVFASSGAPPASQGLEVLAEFGAPPPPGGSTPARAEDLAQRDHVFCLTRSHLESLRLLLPPRAGEHIQLLDPEGADIADPVGGSVAVYRACASRIDECLAARLDDWA